MAGEKRSEMELSARAYAKMILHAAKYPHCAISGLLIADTNAVKDVGSSPAPLSMTVICDAVPLFHQKPRLTPMTEVALARVDAAVSNNGGHQRRKVVGFYHANEHLEDVAVDAFSRRIADKVAANNADSGLESFLLTLDNRRLGVMMTQPALIVHTATSNGEWREEVVAEEGNNGRFFIEEGAVEGVAAMIQKGLAEQLVDFDNHLDDVSTDILNVELNMDIDQCL